MKKNTIPQEVSRFLDKHPYFGCCVIKRRGVIDDDILSEDFVSLMLDGNGNALRDYSYVDDDFLKNAAEILQDFSDLEPGDYYYKFYVDAPAAYLRDSWRDLGFETVNTSHYSIFGYNS